jgi:hypothetical protein
LKVIDFYSSTPDNILKLWLKSIRILSCILKCYFVVDGTELKNEKQKKTAMNLTDTDRYRGSHHFKQDLSLKLRNVRLPN